MGFAAAIDFYVPPAFKSIGSSGDTLLLRVSPREAASSMPALLRGLIPNKIGTVELTFLDFTDGVAHFSAEMPGAGAASDHLMRFAATLLRELVEKNNLPPAAITMPTPGQFNVQAQLLLGNLANAFSVTEFAVRNGKIHITLAGPQA